MSLDKSKAFEVIKEYIVDIGGRDIAWVGDSLPFIECEQLVLTLSTNLRADPVHHNSYKVVFIFSKSIFEYEDCWKLILDESVRLLGDESFLIIRSADNGYGTLFELKSQLFRNKNIDVSLIKQIKDSEEGVISIFRVKKNKRINYKDKSWTIGILSNGKKEDVVINLINSLIEANRFNLPMEFIIAGPEIIDERINKLTIKYVNTTVQDELPRISEKKNKIIDAAEMANIAIFHDRYVVKNDFFEGFENFGYNFEFLTIKQFYENGNEFPAYLAFKHKEKKWQTPLNILNHDLVFSGSFLNGGLIIFKKGIFLEPLFNNLLLHNEAEDVELAFYLSENGIIPRFNGFSSSKTIGIPLDYTSTFINITASSLNRRRGVGEIWHFFCNIAYSVWLRLPCQIKRILKKRTGKLYEKVKNSIHY